MTEYSNNFDGGTDEVAITTGNSGGASGTAWTTVTNSVGTIVYDNASPSPGPAWGLLCARFVPTASSGANYLGYSGFSWMTINDTMWWNFPTLPAAGCTPLWFGIGGSKICSLSLVSGSNLIRLSDSVTTNKWTSSWAASAGGWFGLALSANVGTTTANGHLSCAIYDGLGATGPAETPPDITNANLGTAAMTSMRKGKTGTGTSPGTDFFGDAARWNNDAFALYSVPPPPVSSSAFPISNISNTGLWTGTFDLAADESDATVWESAAGPVNAVRIDKVGSLAAGNLRIKIRARLKPGDTTACTVKGELMQGATLISTATAQNVTTTSWVDLEFVLTGGENAAVTDRTDLRVKLTANQP